MSIVSFCYNVTFIAVNQVNVVTFYPLHYGDIIMGSMASQLTSLSIVYPTVYSDTDQRKHQSSASLVFVLGIQRWPVNSPHKGPVTRKMFPVDDVFMIRCKIRWLPHQSVDSIAKFHVQTLEVASFLVLWWFCPRPYETISAKLRDSIPVVYQLAVGHE